MLAEVQRRNGQGVWLKPIPRGQHRQPGLVAGGDPRVDHLAEVHRGRVRIWTMRGSASERSFAHPRTSLAVSGVTTSTRRHRGYTCSRTLSTRGRASVTASQARGTTIANVGGSVSVAVSARSRSRWSSVSARRSSHSW
jgi:hypothetical protein